MTGIRHSNNKDAWIVVRKHGPKTKYLAYLITASGISSSPVVSASNLQTRYMWVSGQLVMARGGDLKISQDGTKLVCSDSLTEICDFNDLTGVVTPKFKINLGYPNGAEFSVDSRYLYLNQNNNLLWQFDLSNQDSAGFFQNRIFIGSGVWNHLQLAPDWKIYTSTAPFLDSLNCINNPSL